MGSNPDCDALLTARAPIAATTPTMTSGMPIATAPTMRATFAPSLMFFFRLFFFMIVLSSVGYSADVPVYWILILHCRPGLTSRLARASSPSFLNLGSPEYSISA